MKRTPTFGLALVMLVSVGVRGQGPGLKLQEAGAIAKTIPNAIAFSPDGKYWALVGSTGNFSTDPTRAQFNLNMTNIKSVVLLLESGRFKAKKELMKESGSDLPFGGGEPLMFSPDGRRLLAVVSNAIRVWTVDNGKAAGTWGKDLHDVTFSGDGRAALGRRGYLAPVIYEAFDLQDGHSLGSYASKTEGKPLIFDADTHGLLYAKDKTLAMLNLKTGEESVWGEFDGKKIARSQLSPDGRRLIVADDAGTVSIWNATERKKIAEKRFPGSDEVTGVRLAFSPDGSMVAFTSRGKEIHVWTMATDVLSSVDSAHVFGPGELAFSGDSRLLASTGALVDPTIRWWSLPR
jgi:WD40 repeat protein